MVFDLATDQPQRDVIAFLTKPDTYGQTNPVCVHQTHGSVVFLSTDNAYKLKRAVRFPYMDYSTPARRKAMCLRELAVNRRTAPDLYKAVKGIAQRHTGFEFCDASDPRAIDWVVVMNRFEQGTLLEQRRRAGQLGPGDMVALAEAIADFHERAERVDRSDGIGGMRAVVDENASLLAASPEFPEHLVTRYAELSEDWLRRLRPVLGSRRRLGMVRRCHGDLHLNNVCQIDGRPLLFDAIEFNDAFSCIDVGYDLSFMLMDLDFHGLRAHANALLNRYLERFHDDSMLRCLPLFLSCRAAIRAHVSLAAARVGAEQDRGKAAALLDLAVSYLLRPTPKLVAVGGLSGSGKTTVARGLAPYLGAAPGAVVVRSDVVRKAIFGVPEAQALSQEAYQPGVTADVYSSLRDRVQSIVLAGHTAIADATFGSVVERQEIENLARIADVPFVGLWLDAPRAALEARIEARRNDASDADLAVLEQQIKTHAVPSDWLKINAEAPGEAVIRTSLRAIVDGDQ